MGSGQGQRGLLWEQGRVEGRDRSQLKVAGGLSVKDSLKNHRERHSGGMISLMFPTVKQTLTEWF